MLVSLVQYADYVSPYFNRPKCTLVCEIGETACCKLPFQIIKQQRWTTVFNAKAQLRPLRYSPMTGMRALDMTHHYIEGVFLDRLLIISILIKKYLHSCSAKNKQEKERKTGEMRIREALKSTVVAVANNPLLNPSSFLLK